MNKVIDLQKIADELEFDIEDVEMLMGVFVESARESLETLKVAIEHNDEEKILNAAHAIKGSAANLTLVDIASLAKTLETKVREKEELDYLPIYSELNELVNNIQCI